MLSFIFESLLDRSLSNFLILVLSNFLGVFGAWLCNGL